MNENRFALILSDAIILAIFGQVRRTSLFGNERTPSAGAPLRAEIYFHDACGDSISMGARC